MDCKDSLTHKHQKYNEYILSTSNKINEMISNIQYATKRSITGFYSEILLQEILRIFLPDKYGVGTGFVIYGNEITNAIDIIIYDNNIAEKGANFLKCGPIVIPDSNSVRGIIEVKSLYGYLGKSCDKLLRIKQNIGENIFAGFFAFNYRDAKVKVKHIKNSLYNIDSALDCVSFGKNEYACNCKYDLPNQYGTKERISHYDFYQFKKDLSFGYFILTLLKFLKVEI